MVLPTDSGVMRQASDQQTRLAMQGNQMTFQTGMNVGSQAGKAIQQGLQLAEFQEKAAVNRSRLATESLRRQELQLQMGHYASELQLRQQRSQTMMMEYDLKERKLQMDEKWKKEDAEAKDSRYYSGQLSAREGSATGWGIYQPGSKTWADATPEQVKYYQDEQKSGLTFQQRKDLKQQDQDNDLALLKKRQAGDLTKTGVTGEQKTKLLEKRLETKAAGDEQKAQGDKDKLHKSTLDGFRKARMDLKAGKNRLNPVSEAYDEDMAWYESEIQKVDKEEAQFKAGAQEPEQQMSPEETRRQKMSETLDFLKSGVQDLNKKISAANKRASAGGAKK